MLKRAHGCGSCSYNAAAADSCCVDQFRTFCADLVPFAMQLDLSRICDSHWLKRAEPDVQRYRADPYASCPNLCQDFRGKVQPCSWCCCGAPLLCIDCLISLTIQWPVIAVNVRGQRHVSERIQDSVEICHARESKRALPALAGRH